MLNNILKKRVFLIISSIFIIIIIYIFPTKKEDNYYEEVKSNNNDCIIYLLDENNYVSRVSIYLNEKDKNKKIEEIINYITVNSKNSIYIKDGFTPIIPENTKLLSLSIDKTLVKLNFSKEFFNIDESNEEKLISSIIFSVTSIDGIDEVSIYVEGNILAKLPHSNKLLPPTLNRSFGINKMYNFTNIKGTISTTVYYLSKYNDYYYYVPITLVNNNENDNKIEIIIEEMASKNVYQTSLISYLKTAKEINYNITDDNITINFTNSLFNELNNNNLLESVIYSLNLSIKENYDISEVIYQIDSYDYKKYYI